MQNKPPATQPTKGFGVAASPFNQVKIELAIALILGIILWLAAESITASIATQLLLLVSYGLISASWLIVRTRHVLHRLEVQQWKEQNQKTEADSDQLTTQHGRSKE